MPRKISGGWSLKLEGEKPTTLNCGINKYWSFLPKNKSGVFVIP